MKSIVAGLRVATCVMVGLAPFGGSAIAGGNQSPVTERLVSVAAVCRIDQPWDDLAGQSELIVKHRGLVAHLWRRLMSADLRTREAFYEALDAELDGKASFQDLHDAIQDSCGWEDYHLFEFVENNRNRSSIAGRETPNDGPFPFEETAPTAKAVKLSDHCKRKGQKCLYVYDFGDNWEHLVELKQLTELPEISSRKLIDGARAFPPEDCGGVWGYYDCLAALGLVEAEDSDEEELKDRREWLGNWAPEGFGLDAAQKGFDR